MVNFAGSNLALRTPGSRVADLSTRRMISFFAQAATTPASRSTLWIASRTETSSSLQITTETEKINQQRKVLISNQANEKKKSGELLGALIYE